MPELDCSEIAYVADSGPLFVAIDRPQRATGAVLVCGTICWEFTKNYRREVLLGRRLAAQGYTVARFHYRGQGESGGSFDELNVESMTADAAAALALLHEQTGCATPAIVGIRVGALIAAALSHGLGAAPIVFWDPVINGADYVRELMLIQRVWASTRRSAVSLPDDDLAADGSLEVLGYRLSPELIRDLREMRLREVLGPAQKILSLHTGAVPRQARDLAAGIGEQHAGPDVEIKRISERIEWWLKRPVFAPEEQSAACSALTDSTTHWLASQPRLKLHVAQPPWPPAQPPALAAATRRRQTIQPTAAFRGIRRRCLAVPARGADLAGVFVEPVADDSDVAALLLNCGSYHPTSGPIGLWSCLGDRLAELGVASLRIAYRGVADSTGQVEDFDLTRPCTDDLAAARSLLTESGFPRQVLIGGCLGARTACAAPLDGVIGLGLVSLPSHMESLAKSLDLRTKATPAELSRRVLPGEADADSWDRASVDDQLPWLNRGLVQDLQRCVAGQVPIRLIYSREERYRRDFEAASAGSLGATIQRAGSLFEISIIDGTDSMFQTAGIINAMTAFVATLMRPALPV